MSDFIDKNFWQAIVIGLIFFLAGFLFKGRSAETTTAGKKWKVVVIISYIMIGGGIILLFKDPSTIGIKNSSSVLAWDLILLGVPLNLISKFFVWWHRG